MEERTILPRKGSFLSLSSSSGLDRVCIFCGLEEKGRGEKAAPFFLLLFYSTPFSQEEERKKEKNLFSAQKRNSGQKCTNQVLTSHKNRAPGFLVGCSWL